MSNKYKDFKQQLDEQYGTSFLQQYQIFYQLRKKNTENGLTDEEVEILCEKLYSILEELHGTSQVNEIELLGFCDLIRTEYKTEAYRELVKRIQTEDGYAAVKDELKHNINQYELVYRTLKKRYDAFFIEKLELYRRLHRSFITEEWLNSGMETDEILQSLIEASARIDIEVSTSAEFAQLLKNMYISIDGLHKCLTTKLTTKQGLNDIENSYQAKKEELRNNQKISHRVRSAILNKFTNVHDFSKQTGIDKQIISTIAYGHIPNISILIKLAYVTDTSLEYILNGKKPQLGNKNPMESLFIGNKYNADIFLERLQEYLTRNNITMRKLAMECDMSPLTPNNWHVQKLEPATEILYRICNSQHLNLDYMIGLTDKRDESYFVTPI